MGERALFQGKAVSLVGTWALVALLVALSSGCGSGSESGNEVASAKPLPKKEFIKQANALCDERLEERDEKIFEAYEEHLAEAEQLPKAGQEKLEGEVALEVDLPIYRKLVRQLGEMTPPAGDAKTVEKFLSRYEALLDELFEHPERLDEAEPLAPNAEAVSYGLVTCSL